MSAICPECGADPCYLICPNNPDYYTPEREQADDLIADPREGNENYLSAMREQRRENAMQRLEDARWDAEGDIRVGGNDG